MPWEKSDFTFALIVLVLLIVGGLIGYFTWQSGILGNKPFLPSLPTIIFKSILMRN